MYFKLQTMPTDHPVRNITGQNPSQIKQITRNRDRISKKKKLNIKPILNLLSATPLWELPSANTDIKTSSKTNQKYVP